nr:class I SAM-dependent methyltransferase [Desulfitobacterium hafniense]
MFNLGYLPGGDTGITTKPESTIKALSQALRLLQVNGMIVLTIYRGHEGGSQEAQGVNQVLMALSKRDFSVLEGKYINQAINSPYWVVVQKNRGIIYES